MTLYKITKEISADICIIYCSNSLARVFFTRSRSIDFDFPKDLGIPGTAIFENFVCMTDL